jgi:hypothetical protein
MNAIREMIKVAIAFAIVLTTGCAQLKPAAIHLEAEHTSHISQHQPFTDHPTNMGYESLGAGARWQPAKNVSLIVVESYLPRTRLDAMREVFQARLTYEIPLK